jgi:hypothetical protein
MHTRSLRECVKKVLTTDPKATHFFWRSVGNQHCSPCPHSYKGDPIVGTHSQTNHGSIKIYGLTCNENTSDDENDTNVYHLEIAPSAVPEQRWKIVYTDEAEKERSEGFDKDHGLYINRPFYIKSRMPFGRVMESIGASNVTLKKWRNNAKAQQWTFDRVTNTIRNENWKNYALDMQGTNLVTRTVNSKWNQMFRMKGAFLTVERENKVADVSGGLDAENRNIIMYAKHGKINQQWEIVYVDEWKRELSPDFGLIVEKDFYIVSAMPSHKYLDLINNRNMVVKTPNGRKTQIWYFDQKSRTIKTRYNNQSWDIKSSGKSNDMQIWSTNSGWW